MKWCTMLLGDEELDCRFRDAPSTTGLRHFKNGISHVSQWTGHEHKEMEKVFVALVAGGVPDEVLKAVRALIDFIYNASLNSHTTLSLIALRTALDTFHAHKQAFIDYHARHPEHFNIPKYHMLDYYVDLIYSLGSADGFNTEWSERLHIDYAKEAYRASNKKDYVAQMTKWLSRQEAVDRFDVYLEWCHLQVKRKKPQQSMDHPSENTDEPGTVLIEPLSYPNQSTRDSLSPKTGRESTASGPQAVIKTSTYARDSLTLPPTPLRPRLKVPATHPKELREISAQDIILGNGASEFLPALHSFLSSHGATITLRPFDRFNLYKQVVIRLPEIPEVSNKPEKLKNVIKATPPVSAMGRRAARAAMSDFALIQTGEQNQHTDGTALEGKSCIVLMVL